ncbi:MAG: hypothetical protein KGL61_09450 [Burkholderiales bacterium]|nr:hypothetical protein [Burkholderiales bacterium]
MSNDSEIDVPSSAPEFFAKYAGKTFLKEFASKYSPQDRAQMLLNVERILESGDERAFDQAKKALSWDSTLQHKYFVDAKSDQERLNIYTENAWYTKMQMPFDWISTKFFEKKSELLAAASMPLLIKAAAIVAVGTALPIGAGFALAVALPMACEFCERVEKRKGWIEPLGKVLEEADGPLAMRAIAKEPHLMPLREQEQKEMEDLRKTKEYSAMSPEQRSEAELTIRQKGAKRLNETINKLPSTVKVVIHRNSIDQLIEFADNFDHQYSEALAKNAEQIKSVKPSQRDVAKGRIARDVAREVSRDVVFEVSYEGGSIGGIAIARTVGSRPVTFVEDNVIKAADVLKDGYANLKEKLGIRRESQKQPVEPGLPKKHSPAI